jgi:N-methylhydantoinase A
VHTVLSGPAGGVAGALEVARQAGHERIVSFDMGGTSTDVSICPGQVLHTREFTIDTVPVAIPVLDIHTVGAGGGSIAWIDAGGALRVGPQSSGALPGPICYGRGGNEVTVTDAQVWLNRLPADAFLGGQATLDRASIEGPLNELAAKLGCSPEQAAEGVIEVVNTAMEGALRVITVERGYDPVDFTLVAFGGAAGLHAAELAVRLGIPRILLPRDPGLLSAFGMLVSPVRKDAARTVLLGTDSAGTERMEAVFGELEQAVLQQMSEENVSSADVQLSRTVDARYRGQSFELRVPAADWVEGLHRAHEVRYGYSQPTAAVEAVTLRVMGVVPAAAVPPRPLDTSKKKPAPEGTVAVVWQNSVVAASRYQRAQLLAGQSVVGPAVLVEYSSTGWVPPDWSARVDATGQIVLEKAVS